MAVPDATISLVSGTAFAAGGADGDGLFALGQAAAFALPEARRLLTRVGARHIVRLRAGIRPKQGTRDAWVEAFMDGVRAHGGDPKPLQDELTRELRAAHVEAKAGPTVAHPWRVCRTKLEDAATIREVVLPAALIADRVERRVTRSAVHA